MKVVKDTRWEALKTANDFLNQEIPFVTIIADGRVYTAEEGFMTTLMQPSFFALVQLRPLLKGGAVRDNKGRINFTLFNPLHQLPHVMLDRRLRH